MSEKIHEFATDDGVLCSICARTRDACEENTRKIKDSLNDDKFLGEFKVKNAGDWGSKNIHVMTKSREKHEIDKLKEVEGQDLEDLNQFIMDFHFIPNEEFVRVIVCTSENTFLVSTTGRLFSWGAVSFLLGRKINKKEESLVPAEITDIPARILNVAVGQNHILALDITGRVYSWGRNTHGQLGLGSLKIKDNIEVPLPREVEQFKSGNVQNIFAGNNCSFAVTKYGSVYAWGDNKFGQLGFEGGNQVEPKTIDDHPWDRDSEKALGVGNMKRNYVMEFKKNQEFLDEAKKKYAEMEAKKDQKIIELKKKVNELEEQMRLNRYKFEDVSEGKAKDKQEKTGNKGMERKFEDDIVIKDLNMHLESLIRELNKIVLEDDQAEDEFNRIDIEQQDYIEQMKDLSRKQQELQMKRDNLEKSKKKAKDGDPSSNFEFQNLKELIQANENIKNMVSIKKGEVEERKLELIDKRKTLSSKIEDLKKRKAMFQSLIIERERTITNVYVEDNKEDLLKMVKEIHSLHSESKKTHIHNIIQSETELKSFEDLLAESNKRIEHLRKKLQNYQKADKNYALHEFSSRLMDIINDNINLRLQINNYINGIMIQTTNKLEEFYLNYAQKKQKIDFLFLNKIKKKMNSNEEERKRLELAQQQEASSFYEFTKKLISSEALEKKTKKDESMKNSASANMESSKKLKKGKAESPKRRPEDSPTRPNKKGGDSPRTASVNKAKQGKKGKNGAADEDDKAKSEEKVERKWCF